MWKFLKYIPIFLKYLINVGPMVYEVARWGIRIVREFRTKKEVKPPIEPLVEDPVTKPDLDPG
jgi:hypothetical protein